ncbi:proteinaceous RNase P 1, partial [Striga asiatica]
RGPFDAVIDGANLGHANQHKFSFLEIARVVNQMRQISPSKKLPLVVLHQSRCLLVTNDEMRDHLFNLLGNNFFPRWKEKHRVVSFIRGYYVRIKPSLKGLLTLRMPLPYSLVIQSQGSWHIPTVTGDDLETPRQWLCATRMKPQ